MSSYIKKLGTFLLIGALIGLAICSVQVALADEVPPIDSPHWMHGQKAIMDIYTIDTTTLDVLATNEYSFPTADACAGAMAKAMAIANGAVPKGAIAVVKCFAASASKVEGVKPVKPGSTEL